MPTSRNTFNEVGKALKDPASFKNRLQEMSGEERKTFLTVK